MSDIKNPAPFYTLKEAAKELNRLLKIDYYDSKKLLSMALVYDLKLYIYSEGWEGRYIYNTEINQEYKEYLRSENYLTGYSEAQMRKDDTLNTIASNTIICLLHDGCLLQLSQNSINKFRFKKTYEFSSNQANFKEAMYIEDAFSTHTKAYLLEAFKAASQPDYDFLNTFYRTLLDKRALEAIVDVKIDGVELRKPSEYVNTLTMPKFTGALVIRDEVSDFFSGEDSQFINNEDSEFINDEDSEFINVEDSKYSNYVIHRKDILITHSQLLRILEGTLSIRNTEHRSKQELIEYQLPRKPKGRSKEKEHAQLAAKTLASYLWSQDTDNKIKIKEMAITVHAELNQTEHHNQLPDQSVSLKKWIEDIAPEHAREAGRPKGNV